MKTPINNFIKKYANSKTVRLHMPGHKGKGKTGHEKYDITEIFGADELFNSSGIIRDSEINAGKIFDSDVFYSTEGSSLSIRAMVLLASKFALKQGKKPLILAGRNAHKAFLSAIALTNTDLEWIYPKDNEYLSCDISAESLENRIIELDGKVTAVYITTPDYLGNLVDIESLGLVCKKHGALLLVDNAHGAYLKFLEKSLHPITLGADMCTDSAHKTLSALTGGAYLHINKNQDEYFKQNAKECMELFASTSPSYLILNSLDLLNATICGGYRKKVKKIVSRVEKLKQSLKKQGFTLIGNEPLKLTLDCFKIGYSGEEIAKILLKNGVMIEFSDNRYAVMMFSVDTSESDLTSLTTAIKKIKKKAPLSERENVVIKPERKLSVKEAIFSISEAVKIDEALGRTVASVKLSCPPAVAIAVPGEVIDENVIKTMKDNGIFTVNVVKE